MSPEIGLKDLEKKAYTYFHRDGIIDIIIGFCAIIFGVIFYFEPAMYFFFLGLIIVAPAAYVWLKNRITVPRIGLIKFRPERMARIRQLQTVVIVVVILAVVLTNAVWILSAMKWLPQWATALINNYYMVYFGVILTAVMLIGAYLADLKRYYIYGIITLFTFVGMHYLDVPGKLGAALAIVGTIMLLSGIALLYRFMREYSVVKEGQG